MASYSPYPKSKRQPCWKIAYRSPGSNRYTSKLFHGSEAAVKRECFRLQTEPGDMVTNIERVPLNQIMEQYLTIRQHEVAHQTFKHDRRSLKFLSESYTGPLPSLRPAHLEQLKTQLLTSGYAPTGINIVLRHLRIFFRWLVDMEYVTHPIRIRMLRTVADPVRWHSREEIDAIMANADELARQMIVFFLNTGARLTEPFNIAEARIDWDAGVVTLLPGESKNRKSRMLYLNATSSAILREVKFVRGKIWWGTSRDGFQSRYRTACLHAKIDSSPQLLRRTAGAWLIQSGVDIYRVSKWLGHSSVTVTESHYIDLLPHDYTVISGEIMGYWSPSD